MRFELHQTQKYTELKDQRTTCCHLCDKLFFNGQDAIRHWHACPGMKEFLVFQQDETPIALSFYYLGRQDKNLLMDIIDTNTNLTLIFREPGSESASMSVPGRTSLRSNFEALPHSCTAASARRLRSDNTP
jgi:hypothetical protein